MKMWYMIPNETPNDIRSNDVDLNVTTDQNKAFDNEQEPCSIEDNNKLEQIFIDFNEKTCGLILTKRINEKQIWQDTKQCFHSITRS